MTKILPWTDVDKWESYIDNQEWKEWYHNWAKDGFMILDHIFEKSRA